MNWYLIRSATRLEERAETALKERGFEVYWPTFRRFERIGRTKVWEERRRALFPSYLFVLTKDGQFADVEALDGVSGFVRYTNAAGERSPLVASLAVLAEIRRVVASGEWDEDDPNLPPPMEVGDRVRITEGHYRGYFGEIRAMPTDKRVKVMLEAVTRGGWAWQVEVDRPQVEKVELEAA
jgi:transcription antitermination factor NusG